MLDSSDLNVKVKLAEEGKPEYPDKNPQSQIEIDKFQPMSRTQAKTLSQVVEVGCATYDHYANQTPED